MDFLSIILLGLTQGITEWIPVSSKTQVTAVYMGILKGDMNSVIPILMYVHMGTVLAALVYFREEIKRIISDFMKKPMDLKAHSRGKLGFLFTSLLFTGLVGVPLFLLEKYFILPIDASLLFTLMGVGLLFSGVLLLMQRGVKERKINDANWFDGVLTGIMQGLSILPGVSRAGTSTTALMWQGFDSESSFHLSFLLSIPTVIFADIFIYAGSAVSFPAFDGVLLSLTSFIFGYAVLYALLRILRKVNMAYVAFALGIIIIAVGLTHQG